MWQSLLEQMSGNEEQKNKYLPKLASGEYLGAYSLSEAGSGTDAAAMVARALQTYQMKILKILT